jgi:hypothetical protein
MFNNQLFNSTGSGYGMPQYVQQPSSQGPTPRQLLGFNKLIFGGKVQPTVGPIKEFSPTMAIPEWAKAMPAAPAAQFSNPMFRSSPNPYIAAPQSVMQPSSVAPPAKFNGVK